MSPEEQPHGTASVTLASLAARLDVHVSTVSRALSNNPVGVGRDTAERIRRLASEMGYRRNAAARTLRTGQSGMIGVMVPRLTDVVLATIYEGIDQTATAAGVNTVVVNTHDDPALQRSRLDLLLSRRVDGLIVGDSRNTSNLVPELRSARIPFVLVMRSLPRQLSITTDDMEGGRLAAQHLLALGHRDIGVVSGDPDASTGEERTRGFRETFTAAGHSIPDDHVVTSGFDVTGGRRAADFLLRLPRRPSAIFAVNDYAAIGVMGAVRDAGLQVGRDVAVVGYNDVDIAEHLPVALTTVRSPLFSMGAHSVRALMGRLAGKKIRSQRLKPTLVPRASSHGGPLDG